MGGGGGGECIAYIESVGGQRLSARTLCATASEQGRRRKVSISGGSWSVEPAVT